MVGALRPLGRSQLSTTGENWGLRYQNRPDLKSRRHHSVESNVPHDDREAFQAPRRRGSPPGAPMSPSNLTRAVSDSYHSAAISSGHIIE